MRSIKAKSAGFSLIELMVAIVAGLIVSGAVVAFTMASLKSNGEFVQSTRLTQELRNSMDLVTRDLRRAGYDQDALAHMATGTASTLNRLLMPSTAQLSGGPPATYSCVIYAYDRTNTGASGCTVTDGQVDVCNGEVRAIRRASRTMPNGNSVGVIEYAESSGTTRPTCGDAAPDYSTYPPACTGTWCPLSDPSIVDITALVLTDNRTIVGTTVGERMLVRDVGVGITGQLTGTTITRDVRGSVRIRSDCYDPTATGTNPASFGNCTLTP